MLLADALTPVYYAAGILTAIVAGLGALYLARSRRKLNEAQTVESLTKAAMELVGPLHSEVTQLRHTVGEHEARMADMHAKHEECLEREIDLRRQVDALREAMA